MEVTRRQFNALTIVGVTLGVSGDAIRSEEYPQGMSSEQLDSSMLTNKLLEYLSKVKTIETNDNKIIVKRSLYPIFCNNLEIERTNRLGRAVVLREYSPKTPTEVYNIVRRIEADEINTIKYVDKNKLSLSEKLSCRRNNYLTTNVYINKLDNYDFSIRVLSTFDNKPWINYKRIDREKEAHV